TRQKAKREDTFPRLPSAVPSRHVTRRNAFGPSSRVMSRALGSLSAPSLSAIEPPHRRRRVDPQRIVEAEYSHRLAELVRVTVATVAQQDVAGDLVVDGTCDHRQRQVVLGPEDHVLWALALRAARGVARPALG